MHLGRPRATPDVTGSVLFAGGSVLRGVALWGRMLLGREQPERTHT
jgi:hypothetical protein